MNTYLEKVRLAFWKLGQPLTRVPQEPNTVVSDLFIWRNTRQIQTFFELYSIPCLFDPKLSSDSATLFIFNSKGSLLSKEHFTLSPGTRYTLRLSDYIPSGSGSYGTFAIFPSHTPLSASSLGSFISERGYVSYQFMDLPLRYYVHGNLDAIAHNSKSTFQLLGSTSLFRRKYHLQAQLNHLQNHDIALVNYSRRPKTFRCDTFTSLNRLFSSENIVIPPRGCHIYRLPQASKPLRLTITSRLVMSRPLVFSNIEQFLNVFHG